MENFKLNTEVRDGSGKGIARRLRQGGLLPAILYGHKEEPLSLSIREHDMRRILHSRAESAIIDLSIAGQGKDTVNVIVRDVQRHPASGKLLHIDFQRISLDEKVRMEVSIALVNDPRGVKEQGGILEHAMRSLSIMTLPTSIPDTIEIDVAEMVIGDSIKMSDVVSKYPDIDFLDDETTTICILVPPAVEAEVTPEEEEAEGAEEPEVVGKEAEGEEEKESKDES